MKKDIVRDRSYRATDQEIMWLEHLGRVANAALACSEDLVAPVIVYQQASLAAVDVTSGVASHADLREAAVQALEGLREYVNAEPMRRALRKVIAEIDAEDGSGAVSAGVLIDLDEEDNSLPADGDPPRKQPAS